MRRLTQRLSALIAVGLGAAALIAAGRSAMGLAGKIESTLGPASGSPLAAAASVAATIAGPHRAAPSKDAPLL